MTKSEYQARINKLQRIVNKFESRLVTKQNGRFGRAVRLLGLTLAIADLQMEMFAYGTDDAEVPIKNGKGEIIEEEAAETKVFANYCDYCGHEEDKSYNVIDSLAICDSCLPDALEVLNEWEFINACEHNRDA